MKRIIIIFLAFTLLVISFSTFSKSYAKEDIDLINSSCTQVPEGLVYWLRAENDAEDWTGNHDGTTQGGTAFVSGVVGNAFSFDGEDDYVMIPSDPNLPDGADPRTIEMWIYSEDDSWLHDARPAFHTGIGALHSAFGIDFDNHPKIQFYTWVDDLYIETSLPKVGWFHVAMVYDGDTLLSAYINGSLSDSRELSGLLTTENTDTYIGAGIEEHGYPRFYLGKIDEVSMYNRALSGDEVFSIYDAGSNGKCANLAPVANAGVDQIVNAQSLTTLDGSNSYDPDNNLPLTYQWTQIGGERVELNNENICCPAFISPSILGQLTFSLVVTDNTDMVSDSDIVNIFVENFKIYLPMLLTD